MPSRARKTVAHLDLYRRQVIASRYLSISLRQQFLFFPLVSFRNGVPVLQDAFGVLPILLLLLRLLPFVLRFLVLHDALEVRVDRLQAGPALAPASPCHPRTVRTRSQPRVYTRGCTEGPGFVNEVVAALHPQHFLDEMSKDETCRCELRPKDSPPGP